MKLSLTVSLLLLKEKTRGDDNGENGVLHRREDLKFETNEQKLSFYSKVEKLAVRTD